MIPNQQPDYWINYAYNQQFYSQSQLLYYQQSISTLLAENHRLSEQMKRISESVQKQKSRNEELKKEYYRLQRITNSPVITDKRRKRKYSKRRKWLLKAYKCPMEGCLKAYASNIALRAHLRLYEHIQRV